MNMHIKLMNTLVNWLIHDVATKVGDYNKTKVCPGPSLSRHCSYDAIGWTHVHRKIEEICELGKGQHLCMGNFRLRCLLACSNKSPRLIVI